MTTTVQKYMSLQETGQLQTFYQSSYLDLYYDSANDWLYNDWKGYVNTEQVIEGLKALLEAIKHHQCGRVLNDNTNLQGTWTGAIDWIVNEWYPAAIPAGCRAIAFIYSPDVFGKFSVDRLQQETIEEGPVVQQPFSYIEDAIEWLRQQ